VYCVHFILPNVSISMRAFVIVFFFILLYIFLLLLVLLLLLLLLLLWSHVALKLLI